MNWIVTTKQWAWHWWATVEGEHPKSCHGGSHYNAPGSRGKTTCEQGHEIPEQVRWEVEAPWTEDRYQRYAARSFEGAGPCQFDSEQEAIDTAIGRFLGTLPVQWWEGEVTTGDPGDKLWANWVSHKPDDPNVQANWGTVLAEVPAREVTDDAVEEAEGDPRAASPAAL